MKASITAEQVASRIHSGSDGIVSGDAKTAITGIVVSFAPTFNVLRQAAAAGHNLFVCHEPPFWNRTPKQLAENPVFQAKQSFIEQHQMVFYRMRDGWKPGLAEALGWGEGEHILYRRPPTTLQALAREIGTKLKLNAIRVIGDPATPVERVVLRTGLITTPQMAQAVAVGPDAVVIGEPVEWEASPYFQDLITSGQKKGLIVLGLEGSEEPGGKVVAAWLKTMVSEAPVDWIPAGEPFAARRWS